MSHASTCRIGYRTAGPREQNSIGIIGSGATSGRIHLKQDSLCGEQLEEAQMCHMDAEVDTETCGDGRQNCRMRKAFV
jgi:hypothetical protein